MPLSTPVILGHPAAPVPPRLRKEVERILITEKRIASRIRTCVLLNKAGRRLEDVKADYIGFEIPDFFVVGYGLDFAESYRNLPFVGVLHPHVYKLGCQKINTFPKKKSRKRGKT